LNEREEMTLQGSRKGKWTKTKERRTTNGRKELGLWDKVKDMMKEED